MGGVRQRLRQSRPVAWLSFRAMASGADLYAAEPANVKLLLDVPGSPVLLARR